jgi:hypothetical protein
VAVGTDGPVELTCYRASIEGEVADDDDVMARHPEPYPLPVFALLRYRVRLLLFDGLSAAWGNAAVSNSNHGEVWAALGALGREGKAGDSCSPAG